MEGGAAREGVGEGRGVGREVTGRELELGAPCPAGGQERSGGQHWGGHLWK